MNFSDLQNIVQSFKATDTMPSLFVGHGNPMNAIEENEFVQGFRNVATTIPQPNAILVVSAHWETKGTFVTAMEHPITLHDFNGFPKALYEVQYPAPGSPELAKATQQLITATKVGLDDTWGLDHGTWSVVKHFYPNADIPVIQFSLDYMQTPQRHYEIAQQLASLRNRGILMIGSGNMIHNLRMVDWQRMNESGYAYNWASVANEKMKEYILHDNHKELINFNTQGKEFNLAIPTPEHFLPLLYILALKNKEDRISFFNDKAVAGSLTMTSVRIGKP
jgi:4,5-DOPA dioxygenase extradiol